MEKYQSFIELYDVNKIIIEDFYLVHQKETIKSLKVNFRKYLKMFPTKNQVFYFRMWFSVNGQKIAKTSFQNIENFLSMEVE